MQIQLIRSLEDIAQVRWCAVVIDVLRAFSTEAYIMANGARYIVPVSTLEEAYILKQQYPDYILIGERWGIRSEWFDFGNSPTEIEQVDFHDKVIIHTTSNGTRWLLWASEYADVVLTGSFVNVGAIVRTLQKMNPSVVSLVSTSEFVDEENEDILCAYAIRDLLEGKTVDRSDIVSRIRQTSRYAYLSSETRVPQRDLELCLDIDKFDFAIVQEICDGQHILIQKIVA